jgi:uncharacterized membrane protein
MSVAAVDEAGAIKRRTPRWMWVLLVVSLAVNLMILGVAFGTFWAVRNGLWDAPVALERSHHFMQGLPPERRAEVRAIFFAHKAGLMPFWREVRQARAAIGRLIKRGDYTEAELNAAMDEVFKKELASKQASKPIASDILAHLRPNERLHFLSVFMPYLDEVQAQPTAQQTMP